MGGIGDQALLALSHDFVGAGLLAWSTPLSGLASLEAAAGNDVHRRLQAPPCGPRTCPSGTFGMPHYLTSRKSAGRQAIGRKYRGHFLRSRGTSPPGSSAFDELRSSHRRPPPTASASCNFQLHTTANPLVPSCCVPSSSLASSACPHPFPSTAISTDRPTPSSLSSLPPLPTYPATPFPTRRRGSSLLVYPPLACNRRIMGDFKLSAQLVGHDSDAS